MSKNITIRIDGELQNFQGTEFVRFKQTGTENAATYVDSDNIATVEEIMAEIAKKPEIITINWLKNPTMEQEQAEISKIEQIISEWKNDNNISKYIVRVKYNNYICPATVEIASQNNCNIYFIDMQTPKFYAVFYSAPNLLFATKNWNN